MDNQKSKERLLWEELCYILSHNVKQSIDESAFQREIIRAFEKLGWSQFRKEIVEKPPIQIGSSGNIYPDIMVKLQENSAALFVIEVKKPSIDLNSYHANQLLSYMRQVKCELGLLIGNMVQIYWDDRQHGNLELVCLARIPFQSFEINEGPEFIKAFSRDETNNLEELKGYITRKVQKLKDKNSERELKVKILSSEYKQKIIDYISKDIASTYNETLCKNIINQLKIEITIGNTANRPLQKTEVENDEVGNNYDFATNLDSESDLNNSGFTRDNTRYLFDGQKLKKNRLALAIVRKYVNENPNVTHTELERVFPRHIFKGHHQGSNGVFSNVNVIRNSKNTDMLKRFFIQPHELIKLADVTVAVSTQWGLSNITLLIQIANKLRYQIAPANK